MSSLSAWGLGPLQKYSEPYGPDIAMKAIVGCTDSFRARNFETFQRAFSVEKTANATRVFDSNGQYLGYDRYEIMEYSGSYFAFIKIRLQSSGELRLRHLGHWLTLPQFLDQLPTPRVSVWTVLEVTGYLGPTQKSLMWEKQWEWWGVTGKKIPFLSLPAEIREIVYESAFEKKVVAYLSTVNRRIKRCRWVSQALDDFGQAQQPGTNLMKLNRQVYIEASHIFFERTVLRVYSARILQKILRNLEMRTRITGLELALSHKEFLTQFKFRNLRQASDTLPPLRQMKLKETTVDIGEPAIARTTPFILVACQKIAVDWIFEALFPWLAGHHVRVAGYVKDKQKHDFEAQCATERQRYLEWCELQPLGYEQGTLAEYDEWVQEEDGGVRVDGPWDLGAEHAAPGAQDRSRDSSFDMNLEFPHLSLCSQVRLRYL